MGPARWISGTVVPRSPAAWWGDVESARLAYEPLSQTEPMAVNEPLAIREPLPWWGNRDVAEQAYYGYGPVKYLYRNGRPSTFIASNEPQNI